MKAESSSTKVKVNSADPPGNSEAEMARSLRRMRRPGPHAPALDIHRHRLLRKGTWPGKGLSPLKSREVSAFQQLEEILKENLDNLHRTLFIFNAVFFPWPRANA